MANLLVLEGRDYRNRRIRRLLDSRVIRIAIRVVGHLPYVRHEVLSILGHGENVGTTNFPARLTMMGDTKVVAEVSVVAVDGNRNSVSTIL